MVRVFRNTLFLLIPIVTAYSGVVHRYSFDGEGKTAIDSFGGKDGALIGGASLDGTGFVKLDGSNDLVELPSGLVSKLQNATLEAWVIWDGPASSQWQNVLLFGNGSSHWMYLTPNAQDKARFAVAGGGAERKAYASGPIVSDGQTITHLAVSLDGATNMASLYINGLLKGSVKRIIPLDGFEDTTNFLGKPLYAGFPNFKGRILEVRIHDTALNNEKVKKSTDFGPDMLLGPIINLFQSSAAVVRSNSEVTLTWNTSSGAKVSIEPGGVTDVASTGSVTINVAETTNFTLTATDEDGSRMSRAMVVVDDRPIINSFTAVGDGLLRVGDKTTLSWDVTHADFLQIKPDAPAITGVSGSVQVPIYATTQLTLLARNRHGASTATIEVVLPEAGSLKITEFLADNDEGHADDNGEFSDWIEIQNTGPVAEDLSRWSLSDDSKNLKKWTFPDGQTLAKGARILVFASGKGVPGPQGFLHTNFKLDPGKGNYLALVREDGLVGSMYANYVEQRENISHGRLEMGTLPAGGKFGDVGFFTIPTPGQVNRDGYLHFVKDTTFSHKRGFYESAFTLQIKSSTPDALIYYTLDGSEPSASSGILYQSPFEVASTTCVRARAYKSGFLPTNIDTQTFLFPTDVVRQSSNGQAPKGWPSGSVNGQTLTYGMDPDIVGGFNTQAEVVDALKAVPTMSIVTEIDNLFHSSKGIYVNAGRKGKTWERPASLELIHPDGAKGFQINMGLRIRGGYSRSNRNPKHSFRIFFRGEYGEGSLKYPLFGDEGADRFDKFDFRTSQNYSWAFGGPNKNTMVREVFSRDTQGAMGWAYTRSRYYHIYLNGTYWGLYQTQERVGADFCANYLGGQPEDYDVMKQADNRDMSATAGRIDDYNLFWEQANTGFKSDANYYKAQGLNPDGITPNPSYRKYLDPDNLIDYMIITYWTADRDGPGSKYTRPRPNNYYCFFNRTNPQGFQFMEHDSEHSLGANENNMVTPRLTDDSRTWKKEWFNAHWLHERLTENKEYVVRFYDRVYKHLYNDGIFVPANAIPRINFRANQIDKAIIAESARWGDQKTHPPRNRNNWLSDVQFVRDWINNREPTILSQLRGQGWYPNTIPPSPSNNGGEVASGYRLSLSASQGSIYYTLDGTDPRSRGGSVAGTAKQYSSSFTLSGPRAVVKTRALNGQEWSPIRDIVFLVGAQPATAQNVAITEINYNPDGPTATELTAIPTLRGDEFEYIELKNLGTKTISLAGAKFVDGVTFTFGDVNLAGGEQVLLVKNLAAFELRYGKTHNIAGEYTGSLRNSGEWLELVNSSGNEIRKFEYKDNGVWPGRADGNGSSLEIIDPKGDSSLGSNWRSSSEFGGTPGEIGQGADNRVVINEVLTHTDPPLRDSIELFNTTDHAIDLGGWFLSDSAKDFRKFRIPTGTSIKAGGYLVFTEDQFNPDPVNAVSSGFALSSAEGDSVWLMEADTLGNLKSFVDHVEFSAARNGESFGRWPNFTGKLHPMETTSIGQTNTGPRIGPLVLTEIHYNPQSGNQTEEFLEIANPTAESINLAHWKLRGGVDYDFPDWANISASGLLLLVPFDSDDPYKIADFKAAHGITKAVNIHGPWTGGNLDNGGQTIRILRPDTLQEEPGKASFYPMLIEEELAYDDLSPWPTNADGQGGSLQRNSTTTWAQDSSSWTAASPTPGEYPGLGSGDTDSDGMPDDWEQLHFGNGDQVATADFDNDGLANLLEFALGSNPANPNSLNLPATGIDQGKYLTVSFKQLAELGDLTYKIEVADNLENWESGNGMTEILSSVNEGDYNIITIRDKTDIATQSKRFIRIVVETQ